jgi:chemotaxis protein CheZ
MTGTEQPPAEGEPLGPPYSELQKELENLSTYIRKVRSDLAAIGPAVIKDTHIKRASTQLDEVIQATEAAANQIMDACDVLQAVANDVGGDGATRINNAVTTIYEACGFQDLTGQRIVIVNKTLSYIETKLDELIDMLGITEDDAGGAEPPKDKTLMNGPAVSSEANDQSAIDRLLSDLG